MNLNYAQINTISLDSLPQPKSQVETRLLRETLSKKQKDRRNTGEHENEGKKKPQQLL